MGYKTIVGLEIHVELSTKTKAFCSCANEFGADANTRVCPVCLALPGALPVLNKQMVEYTIMAGLAFHCDIANHSRFDRKNYFYPDLTKGFQITQNNVAICNNGYITIPTKEGEKKIRLFRIHMEEDTGKSLHTETGETLMDYNRCGVPLIEIVSKPDLSSGAEARLFLEKLKSTLKYLGVSDGKMEEGSMRCDVNVNVVDEDTKKKTSVTEVKNMNSFRGVEKAVDFEVNRHIELLEKGIEEGRTTRRWDDILNETVIMRRKDTASDYRFGPEGDLPPVHVTEEEIEKIRSEMPELPEAKKERFIKEYNIPLYDAEVLTANQDVADFYEKAATNFTDYNMLSNWVMGEVLRRYEEDTHGNVNIDLDPEDLSYLLQTIKEGKINNNAGKKVLREMVEKGKKPETIIKEQGLIQISDTAEIEKLVDQVLEENKQSVEDYKAGKDRAFGFLVGQAMKASKGKANPQMINTLLKEKLQK